MESIGVKIQVDGGKQFRAELENIKQTSKLLSQELKNVVNGLDATGDKEADAAKQAKILTEAYENSQKKAGLFSQKLQGQVTELVSLERELDAAKKAHGANSEEVAKLTYKYTQQKTEIEKTKTELAKANGEVGSYKNQLKDLGYTTDGAKMSQRELAKAAKEAGKDAEKASKGWTIIKGAIKDFVVSAVKSAVNGLKNLVKEAINASDAMGKFEQTLSFGGFDQKTIDATSKAIRSYADKTVYDLETIANTTATLGANGVKDFEKLTEAMGNLNAVAGGDANSFQSVALALTQTAGAGKLTTENWRQMMNQIPGAAGVLKQALLDAGAYTGNFEEALKKGQITAEEFNAAIMQVGNQPIAVEAATSAQTFEGAMGNLKATAVGALQSIIDMVGMENITGFLNGVSSFIADKVIPAIQEVGEWVGENLMPSVQESADWIKTNVLPVVQTIVKWFVEKLAPAIGKVVQFLREFLLPIIQSVIGWIQQHVVPVIEKIIGFLGTIIPPLIEKIVKVLGPVVNFLKTLLAPAFKLISDGIGFVIDMAGKLVDFFKNMKIKLPEIKLPHFKITGKFSLSPLQVPKLDIDWYDKGGIFSSPSIIGVGEKRPEFVGALDDLRSIVREESMSANVNINVYAADNMDVNELAGIISDKIQTTVMRRDAVYA